MAWEGWKSVTALGFDVDNRELFVEVSAEAVHTQPIVSAAPVLASEFSRVTYRTDDNVLVMRQLDGRNLEVEVWDEAALDPLRGRRVIYLDQNHWVTMGRSVERPASLSVETLDVCRRLRKAVEDRQVILPISSGHLTEAARTTGAWRRETGPTMIELSRGWVLRHPLAIRREELENMCRRLVGGDAPRAARDPITLDPDALNDTPSGEVTAPPDWPEEMCPLHRAITTSTAISAVFVEDEITDSPAGRALAGKWASTHQTLAQELGHNPRARARARDLTRALFISDISKELNAAAVTAGLTTEAGPHWFRDHAETDLSQLPFVGRLRETIHAPLMNTGDRWEENDLVDLMFLPCAAVYVDAVVCERKTANYLRKSSKNGTKGAALFTRLSELDGWLPG